MIDELKELLLTKTDLEEDDYANFDKIKQLQAQYSKKMKDLEVKEE